MKNLKVLIVNPPIRLTDKPRHIPHGLAILANVLRKKEWLSVRFLDINAHRYNPDQVRSLLKSIPFDVVLIGGLIPVYKRIIYYADMIKEINSRAIVISGGSAAMSVPRFLLEHSKVDVVCAGEGEKVIVDLLKGLKSHGLRDLVHVKGFYFKVDSEITYSGKPDLLDDLDADSDLPAYDLLPMDIYLSNPIVGLGRDVDFISSRGCPFNCTFCYQPWGRKFRAHSVKFIISALKNLRKEYGIDFVSFQDDEFLANKKRVYEFCDVIKREIPGLLWSCTGRANLVSEDIVSSMKDAGCVSISYGFESGSPRILKSMNKRVVVEEMEKAIKINRKFGMMLPVSFMIGMPEEDDSSCRETVEFCVRNKIPLKSMMFVTPYPGTKMFEYAVSSNRIPKGKIHDFVLSLEDARDFTINLTDAFSNDELIAKREEMIKEVCSRVKWEGSESYKTKLKSLFGNLADDYFKDKELAKHRMEHGGIDIF